MTEETHLKEEDVIAKLDAFAELPDAPPKRRIKTVVDRKGFRGSRRILAGDCCYWPVDSAFS